MTAPFELHPRLVADTHVVGDLPLSRILLMNDARYPWFILAPRVSEAREIFDLPEHQQQQLLQESAAVYRFMQSHFRPHKFNYAALGNVVPQLHLHHIARFVDDEAWPAPVWGRGNAVPYTVEKCEALIAATREALL